MIQIIRTCFLWRFFSSIGKEFPVWYENSVLNAIFSFFSCNYEKSALKRVWQSFVSRKTTIYTSVYGRTLSNIGSFFDRMGEKFMPIYREAIFYKAVCSIGRGLRCAYCKLFNGSVLGRQIAKMQLNFRRVMLIGVGFYMPIDYVLRNIVKISFLSSLWDEAFFAFSIMYIIARRIEGKKAVTRNNSHASPLDIPILLFCTVSFFLMCVNSPVLGIAIDGFRATVQYILWFFVVIRLIENDGDVKTLAAVLGICGVAVSLHGCYQYIVGTPIPASWVSRTEAGVRTRAFSITGSPNILGAFIVLTAPIVASFAYTFHSAWKKIFTWGAVGVMCLCLLVTFSRGAWIGMCVAVVIFAILQDRKLFVPLAIAVPTAMFIPSIANRITYLFTDDFATASAVGGRALRWGIGRDMMNTNPLVGFGLGRFGGAVAMQNQIMEVTEEFKYFYMDNYYLKIGAEMGYTGLIVYIILIAALIFLGLRCVSRARIEKSAVSPIAVGIFSGICGICAHCYFENIFEVPYMAAIFWALAAALMYFGYVRKTNG